MARRRTKIVLGVILVLVILLVVGVRLARRIPSQTVLEMTLAGAIAEEPAPDLPARMWEGDVSVLRDLLDALERARTDARIAGLVVRIHPFQMNMAKIQDLRDKLAEFNRTGKFSLAFLEFADNQMYYLASACQEIYQVPTSELRLVGLMAHSTFLRGTLDKLHIYPDMYHIAEYKTAKNLLTEKHFTPAHREVTETLLRGLTEQFVAGIAAGRQLQAARVEDLIRQGPYSAEEAKAVGLVDELLYSDQLREVLKKKTGREEPNVIDVQTYLARTERGGGRRVAIVHATGAIDVGQSRFDPLFGRTMGSDTIAAALRAAREDNSIKAIVFRVDSPGGSAIASEIIRREVALAKEKKPVVVSMSDLAGSGGYWISMSAKKIVAQPGTLTASIGVVSGKLNLRGFYELLGLTKDQVFTTENSGLVYEFQNYTPQQRESILKMMRNIYDNFLAGVSAGRGMAVEEVHRIAKGRVWLGAQAQQLGLVDELGGLERAIGVAKELAGIPAEERVEYIIYPRRKTVWQQMWDWLWVRSGQLPLPGLRESLDPANSLLARQPVLALTPFLLEVR